MVAMQDSAFILHNEHSSCVGDARYLLSRGHAVQPSQCRGADNAGDNLQQYVDHVGELDLPICVALGAWPMGDGVIVVSSSSSRAEPCKDDSDTLGTTLLRFADCISSSVSRCLASLTSALSAAETGQLESGIEGDGSDLLFFTTGLVQWTASEHNPRAAAVAAAASKKHQ